MSYSKIRQIRRFLINIYHTLNVDKLFMRIGLFDSQINNALKKFKGNSNLSDSQLRKDIKDCYYKYLTTPQEYFLFRFFEINDKDRSKFLSDNQKVRHLLKTTGEKIYVNQLSDKYNFYKLTSNYFKRNVRGGAINVLIFMILWIFHCYIKTCLLSHYLQVLVMEPMS